MQTTNKPYIEDWQLIDDATGEELTTQQYAEVMAEYDATEITKMIEEALAAKAKEM